MIRSLTSLGVSMEILTATRNVTDRVSLNQVSAEELAVTRVSMTFVTQESD